MGLLGWAVLIGVLFLLSYFAKTPKKERLEAEKRKHDALKKYGKKRDQPSKAGATFPKRKLPSRIEFQYKDADGNETQRVVRPIDIGSGLMNAFCELRRKNRTFYLKRIIGHSVIDVESGEVLDVREL